MLSVVRSASRGVALCSEASISKREFSIAEFATTTSAVAAVGAGAVWFAMHRYKVSKPNEWLVRSGLGIKDVLVTKQGFQWPFQTYTFVPLDPTIVTVDLHAMSNEKLEFHLPCAFTVGPNNDVESIAKAARFLSADSNAIQTLMTTILAGETRILMATLKIEEIFNDRNAIREKLVEIVGGELKKFGLEIYNANIADLRDSANSRYFENLKQKTQSEAENRAKADIAAATKKGDISRKEREAETRQQIAQLEADTVQLENARQQEIVRSKAELEVVQAEAQRKAQIAQIEAVNAARSREAELQKDLEMRRAAMETEKLRASDMSKAQVKAETVAKDAEGIASALRVKIDAEAYATRLQAEASLFSKEKEAMGVQALLEAQSAGVNKLLESFDGKPQELIQYLMVEKDMFERLATANAKAIQGLEPKITVWSTGSEDGYTKPIADVLKMVPPLLTTIKDQTGISPPAWLATMPSSRLQE